MLDLMEIFKIFSAELKEISESFGDEEISIFLFNYNIYSY